MAERDVIVVAASAGGIEALQAMLAAVPQDLDASILVVLHIPPGGGRALASILERAGPLPATTAVDGEVMRRGHIYVAPGDHHLLVGNRHLHVVRGPRENGSRPAADPLFRSAARYYGPRVIGVILSGSLSDGTAGLDVVRRQGGVAIVQAPGDAMYDGMPTSALEYVGADHVLPAAEIGPLLARLVTEQVDGARAPTPSADTMKEVELMEGEETILGRGHPGTPSQWPCPDCNGVLWEIDERPILRFRGRVGHAWTADNLLEMQEAEIETALWMAPRSLEDRLALAKVLAERGEASGPGISAGKHHQDVQEMEQSVSVLCALLQSHPAVGG